MDDEPSREIADGLQEGRPEAWRALYEAYSRQIWSFVARRLGPNSADVADVVQETFMAAAQSAHRFDRKQGSLWSWLTGIARRHVALHYRKQSSRTRLQQAVACLAQNGQQIVRWLDSREASPPDCLATAELAAVVRATLANLPSEYETLLMDKYLEGITVQEMAESRDQSETAVRSRLARARRAFRKDFLKTTSLSGDCQTE